MLCCCPHAICTIFLSSKPLTGTVDTVRIHILRQPDSKKKFSLGSLSMSNPVLFPVAMCSPVRPFPSCPFSPLPQAYTVNRGQPPIQGPYKKSSSRALSMHSEEQCECNASRGSNDVLLFASLWVKRPVHEPECANFWAGRVPALLYLPAVNGVWATVEDDCTCPSEFNPAVHTRPLLPTRTE
jgi:hypothetical protein